MHAGRARAARAAAAGCRRRKRRLRVRPAVARRAEEARRRRRARQLGAGRTRAMRFDAAVRRLETLPESCPSGPPELMPVARRHRRAARPPAVGRGGRGVVAAGRGAGAAVPGRRRARPASCSPSEPIAAGIIPARCRSRAAGRSRMTSMPPRRRCARQHEEVGLDVAAAGVRVLGELPVHWIPVSNFAVTPVIAVAGRRPVLVAAAERGGRDPRARRVIVPARVAARDRRARHPRRPRALRRLPDRGPGRLGHDRARPRAASGRGSARD